MHLSGVVSSIYRFTSFFSNTPAISSVLWRSCDCGSGKYHVTVTLSFSLAPNEFPEKNARTVGCRANGESSGSDSSKPVYQMSVFNARTMNQVRVLSLRGSLRVEKYSDYRLMKKTVKCVSHHLCNIRPCSV